MKLTATLSSSIDDQKPKFVWLAIQKPLYESVLNPLNTIHFYLCLLELHVRIYTSYLTPICNINHSD